MSIVEVDDNFSCQVRLDLGLNFDMFLFLGLTYKYTAISFFKYQTHNTHISHASYLLW